MAGDTVVVERRLIFGGSVERRPNMRVVIVSLNNHVDHTKSSRSGGVVPGTATSGQGEVQRTDCGADSSDQVAHEGVRV